jgi:hypothetical protein
MTTFGTLNEDGTLTNVREIAQSSLMECPFAIMDQRHYRVDESCKCDDAQHREFMIKEWEYTEESFKDIPLRGSNPVDPEVIKDRYQERIVATLQRVSDALNEAGFVATSPVDLSSDYYWWAIEVTETKEKENPDQLKLDIQNDSERRSVDVKFEIIESEEYDGIENGVNFGLDLTAWGGEMLGGLTPYNYTDGCWVDRGNEVQVERRFKILEDAEVQGVIELVTEHFEKKP